LYLFFFRWILNLQLNMSEKNKTYNKNKSLIKKRMSFFANIEKLESELIHLL